MNRIADRPSVLIVDDAPENIDLLSGILENDYHILVANNGDRAQEVCRRHLPALILLDVMMPGVDGYQVCRRLKQDAETSDIPVIFVTAADRDEDEIAGLAAGAVDFLTKPVRPAIVAARVRTHVELKVQRDRLRKLSQLDGRTGVASRRSFDPEVGLRRTGGVWERYRSFVSRFVTEHAGDGRFIVESLERGDRAGARRLAHTLESVAGSLGANALADSAEWISRLLNDGGDPQAELARFGQELQAALREMCRLVGATSALADAVGADPVAEGESARVISQLAAMVASYDGEAIWLFEEHRQAFEQALTPEQFGRLSAALSHFDYDSAIDALRGAMRGEGERSNDAGST